jgi:hypothetical protein
VNGEHNIKNQSYFVLKIINYKEIIIISFIILFIYYYRLFDHIMISMESRI